MGEHPARRTAPHRQVAACLMAMLAVLDLVACAPSVRAGGLPPTLQMESVDGGQIAVQNGIPVPTFDFEPRQRIDLSGEWRVQRARFDADLSLTNREEAMQQITATAEGRERPGFDDSGWEEISVPGALNLPPDAPELGGWYRRGFKVPPSWAGLALTLKFGAVNYLADVWLNGVHLGYHEGGYTPFAFDAAAALRLGELNLIVVRVDNPPWGSRNDIVPWGLTDWWNYGGITRPIWLEATPQVHAVRADVVPHLDGADVSVVVRNAAPAGTMPSASGQAPAGVPNESAAPEQQPGRHRSTWRSCRRASRPIT